ARHPLAGSIGPHGHTDGRAQIALMDIATAARSDRARMPPTNDCRSSARAGPARLDSHRIEVDPRHRTRGRTIEPGFRKRARSGGVKNVAPTNPEIESGAAEVTRSPGLWQGFYCGGRRLACNILQRAAGTAATTEFVNPRSTKRNPGNAGAGRETV